MRDEKLHAVVARSTCPGQNAQSTPCSDHFWKLRCRKVHAVVARSTRTTFGCSDVVSRGKRKGLCTLSKVSKTWVFSSISKNDGRCGTFKRIWKDGFRVAGAVQETCSSEMLGGQGADFLRGRVAFWSIKPSVLGRWFCVTGAALCMTWHHFLVAGAILRDVDRKNRTTHWYEAVSSALNFPLLKEVSQNCFVFALVNFENWGSLAELLRFCCCQVQKTEEISQNSFVFKLAARQIDR